MEKMKFTDFQNRFHLDLKWKITGPTSYVGATWRPRPYGDARWQPTSCGGARRKPRSHEEASRLPRSG